MDIRNLFPIKKIIEIAKEQNREVYVVGGFLRDAVMNRDLEQIIDLDFAIDKRAAEFAREVADACNAAYVLLAEENDTARVVFEFEKDKRLQCDFAGFRADSLHEDLLLRDFSINALALPLSKILDNNWIEDIIDVCGGLKDIQNKYIRMVNNQAFVHDPVRIIRAFAFAAGLGFAIEKNTMENLASNKMLLEKTASERISQELLRLFGAKTSYQVIKQMDESGVLEVIFPQIKDMKQVNQGPYHHLDVWEHSLESLKQGEILFDELIEFKDEKISSIFSDISKDRVYTALLRIAILLHDIGKPSLRREDEDGKIYFWKHDQVGGQMAEGIFKRLKFSSSNAQIIKKFIANHLYPAFLLDAKDASERAWIRFFRKMDKHAPGVIFVSMADRRATRGPLSEKKRSIEVYESMLIENILKYYDIVREKKKKRILTGNQVMDILKIGPSPKVGEVLEDVEETHMLGKINTQDEAVEYIRDKYGRH